VNGTSPEFIVIDAQALGCSNPDDTTPVRPTEDCAVLNIPAPELCATERAPLRATIFKVLRTVTPLTTPQVDLLRSWHETIGAPGRSTPEAAAAELFFRFFPVGRDQHANAPMPGGVPCASGSSAPSSAAETLAEGERPTKRGRPGEAGCLEAALRLDRDGALVLGGREPLEKMLTVTWRNRLEHCGPAFDCYASDDYGLWIRVRPFLQAILPETVSGMFQSVDERAVRLRARTLRLMRRGAWRSLTEAVDGVRFVAGFLGWSANLIDEEPSMRKAVGVLLLAIVDVEEYVDDTFKALASNEGTLAAGWKNAAYCSRWKGRPTTADYKRWRDEQEHLGEIDEDDPLDSFELFAGLPRVRPGITDSEAAKRRV